MDSESAVRALAALAHETRLEVFRLLVRAGSDGLAPGTIAEALEIPPATLSFHLKELKIAGVVHSRREGRSLIYLPDFTVMNDLLGFLTTNCCQGAAACAPKTTRKRRASA